MSLPTGIGELIAGKYRVERLLGAGGMGVVFAARHEALHEMRAIKLLQPKGAHRAELCERFLREAQTVARLRSEHIARIHDVGTLDGGVPYMVMEYVDGTDLSTFLRRRGPLPVDDAVLYALQACEALAEAHRHGIVHRDIKPANLFVTHSNDGSPCIKVLDFGIAKTTSKLTDVGVVLGTPRYMPPEQLRATRDVDARADLWALGVVLYEMLAGRTPFQGDTAQVYEAIFEKDPAPPSTHRAGLPGGLDAVILRCLEKDRDRRPPHVAALAEALGPFAGESARALPARVRRVLGTADMAVEEPPSPGVQEPPSPEIQAPPSPGIQEPAAPVERKAEPASGSGPQTESLVRPPEPGARIERVAPQTESLVRPPEPSARLGGVAPQTESLVRAAALPSSGTTSAGAAARTGHVPGGAPTAAPSAGEGGRPGSGGETGTGARTRTQTGVQTGAGTSAETDATTILSAAGGPQSTMDGTFTGRAVASQRRRLYAVAAAAGVISTAALAALVLWPPHAPAGSAPVVTAPAITTPRVTAPPDSSSANTAPPDSPPANTAPPDSPSANTAPPGSAPPGSPPPNTPPPVTAVAPVPSRAPEPKPAPPSRSPAVAKPGQPARAQAPALHPAGVPAPLPTTRNNF